MGDLNLQFFICGKGIGAAANFTESFLRRKVVSE